MDEYNFLPCVMLMCLVSGNALVNGTRSILAGERRGLGRAGFCRPVAGGIGILGVTGCSGVVVPFCAGRADRTAGASSGERDTQLSSLEEHAQREYAAQ